MKISLTEASSILNLTNDEVLYLAQSDKIKAIVNKESLVWEFLLSDVLTLKNEIDIEE